MKSIKTILMLMCMVPMIALTSCSKDDTTEGGNASIMGKWKLLELSYHRKRQTPAYRLMEN